MPRGVRASARVVPLEIERVASPWGHRASRTLSPAYGDRKAAKLHSRVTTGQVRRGLRMNHLPATYDSHRGDASDGTARGNPDGLVIATVGQTAGGLPSRQGGYRLAATAVSSSRARRSLQNIFLSRTFSGNMDNSVSDRSCPRRGRPCILDMIHGGISSISR
jgi:hypothetical protein